MKVPSDKVDLALELSEAEKIADCGQDRDRRNLGISPDCPRRGTGIGAKKKARHSSRAFEIQ